DIHEAALASACVIAARHEAHVVALVGVSMVTPIATAWAYYPAGIYETMDEVATATTRALAEAVEQRLARETASHEIRRSDSLWLTSAELAALHARYADLVVLGVGRPIPEADKRLFAGLLRDSGRPVLMVPAGAPMAETCRHAVVAWKSSGEAARAVHDALPLLLGARSVDVLVIEREPSEEARHEIAGCDIATHLSRHGLTVNVVQRPYTPPSTAQSILAYAQACGADLIVAGGYSRTRALEQVFGGVTRSLLEHATVPVLFSH
ncbi:MAG: universal stress protein, partial [Lysobacter sp.]